MDQCKEILRAMGIPVIESPEESDSQCANLTKNDIVYGVGSEDMDILTFGSKKLLRNISSSKKNEIIEYDLVKVLEELKYTNEQFIDLCILLGCDYVDHIDGIGVKKAKEIIDEFKSIENFLEKSLDIINEKYIIPINYLEKVKSARIYFLTSPSVSVANTQLKLNEYFYIDLYTNYIISDNHSNERKEINRIKNKVWGKNIFCDKRIILKMLNSN
jgi:flap endonuclease-1